MIIIFANSYCFFDLVEMHSLVKILACMGQRTYKLKNFISLSNYPYTQEKKYKGPIIQQAHWATMYKAHL